MTLFFQLYKSTFPRKNTSSVGLRGPRLKIAFCCYAPIDDFNEIFTLSVLHYSKVTDGRFLQLCVNICNIFLGY